MPRPAGSYRGSRRNEAKQSKQPMLTLDEVRRINEIHARQRQSRPAADQYRAADEPLVK